MSFGKIAKKQNRRVIVQRLNIDSSLTPPMKSRLIRSFLVCASDKYDFDFSPGKTNIYVPEELLEQDDIFAATKVDEEVESPWRPFTEGGFLDVDVEELVGFGEVDDWDLLEDEEFDENGQFVPSNDDEIWTA